MSPYSREKIERYVAGSSLNVTSIPGDSIRLASSPKSSSRFFFVFPVVFFCSSWNVNGWLVVGYTGAQKFLLKANSMCIFFRE